MLKLISLFAMALCFAFPAAAEDNNSREIVLVTRVSDEDANLNPAQVYERKMLEQKQQRAVRRKSKRLTGSMRSAGGSGNVASYKPSSSSSSSAPAARQPERRHVENRKPGLSSDRRSSSLASGMFVK